MLDYFLLKNQTSYLKERFNAQNEEYVDDFAMFNESLSNLLSFITSCIAAYLSWNCSRNVPSMITRIMHAIFAFLFGIFYLIYYYLVRIEHCEFIQKVA